MREWRETTVDNNNKFVSTKLWFDVQSVCLGFRSMVAIKTAQFPSAVIKPALVNQDGVENHFCQVRSCNGQNNNPTYLQQESAQNSIHFGQTTISRKSNVGKANDNSLVPCQVEKSIHAANFYILFRKSKEIKFNLMLKQSMSGLR